MGFLHLDTGRQPQTRAAQVDWVGQVWMEEMEEIKGTERPNRHLNNSLSDLALAVR